MMMIIYRYKPPSMIDSRRIRIRMTRHECRKNNTSNKNPHSVQDTTRKIIYNIKKYRSMSVYPQINKTQTLPQEPTRMILVYYIKQNVSERTGIQTGDEGCAQPRMDCVPYIFLVVLIVVNRIMCSVQLYVETRELLSLMWKWKDW